MLTLWIVNFAVDFLWLYCFLWGRPFPKPLLWANGALFWWLLWSLGLKWFVGGMFVSFAYLVLYLSAIGRPPKGSL